LGKKLALALSILLAVAWILPAYFTLQTTVLPTFASPLNLGNASLKTWLDMPWSRLTKLVVNSAVVCLANAALSPVVCIMAGYAFARYDFPGKEQLFYLFLVALAVPGTMLFLPRYLIVSDLGWTNTFLGIVAPVMMNPAMVFLSRQYLSGIDQDVIDAARLDGASEFRIFRSIILPLSVPLLVLVGIGAFSAVWGDFMWQYLVARDYQTVTVGLGLFILSQDAGTQFMEVGGPLRGLSLESMRAAASVIQSVPLVLVFAVGQKWFMRGVRL